MIINSVQGANAYTNTQNTSPAVDTAKLKEQNLEVSRTELNTENSTAAQQAFEVSITQEAQQLSAKNNEVAAKATAQQAVQPIEDQTTENQANSDTEPVHERSQIVNIVA